MKRCPHCSNPIEGNARRCPFCGRNLDLELAKKLEKQKADRTRRVKAIQVVFFSITLIGIAAAATLWVAVYSPFGTIANQKATQTAVFLNQCHPTAVRQAAHLLIGYNDEWADRMALVVVRYDREAVIKTVEAMQKTRREAKSTEAPECLLGAKADLIEGMGLHIDGLLDYLAGKPLDEVNPLIADGNRKMNRFADTVERIQRCAPNCP